jgi:hypothetical protein
MLACCHWQILLACCAWSKKMACNDDSLFLVSHSNTFSFHFPYKQHVTHHVVSVNVNKIFCIDENDDSRN